MSSVKARSALQRTPAGSPGPAGGVVPAGPAGGGTTLDAVDKALVVQLQQDGRRSYTELARRVGLSEAAVRHRVQRLRGAGVMDIVAITNPLRLGLYRMAVIGVRANGDIAEVARRLALIDEVDYLVVCAGSFDLLAEVVCESDDHLLNLLNGTIRTVPGVRVAETFVHLELAKETYAWGSR
jgi:Lrp/AsnC family transcriptional regulator for asnA, asnC and gidA